MSEVLNQHSRMPRKYLADGTPQPRDEGSGRFLAISDERKEACLADVRPMLMSGATLDDIAAKHQVAPKTLDLWLAQIPEEHKETIRQWIDYKLVSSEERMENATDPFQLAKGRELARLAMWRAERRDPGRYADKRELTVKQDEPTTPEAIRERIGLLEQRLGVRVIDHKPDTQETQQEAA
jgi:hypothetical protein